MVIMQGEKRFIKIRTIVGLSGRTLPEGNLRRARCGASTLEKSAAVLMVLKEFRERASERATAHCLQLWRISGASLGLKGTIVS